MSEAQQNRSKILRDAIRDLNEQAREARIRADRCAVEGDRLLSEYLHLKCQENASD